MTTLTDIVDLIKKDDEQIIKNQEKGNQTLTDLNNNFEKFFTGQERQRLDLLEESRKRSRAANRPAGRTVAGGMLGGAGGGNGLLSTLTSPKALLGALGMTALALAVKPVTASVKALRNAIDDYAKTTRGLNRIEADRLKELAKAEAKARKMEAEKLKVQERFKRAELNAAVNQEIRNKNAAAAEKARLREQADKARVDFEQTREMRLRAKEEARNLSRIAKDAAAARKIQSTQLQADTLGDIRATIDATVRRPGAPGLGAPQAPGALNIGDGVKSAIIQGDVKVTTDLGTGSSLKSPSAIATDSILKKYSADDLARVGMQAVDTPFGVRFKSLDPSLPGFVKSVDVLAELDKNPPMRKSKVGGKILGGAGLLLEGAFAASAAGAELKTTGDDISAAEVASIVNKQTQASVIGGTVDMVTSLARYLEQVTLGRAITPQTNVQQGMVSAYNRRLQFEQEIGYDKSYWNLSNLLGLNNISGKSLKKSVIIMGDAADTAGRNIVNTFTGSGAPSPYAGLTQQDYLNMANPQNVRGGALMDYSQYYTGANVNSGAGGGTNVVQTNNNNTQINPIVIEDTPTISDTFNGGLPAN